MVYSYAWGLTSKLKFDGFGWNIGSGIELNELLERMRVRSDQEVGE